MGMIKSLAYKVGSFAAVPRLLQQAFAPEAAAILMYHAVIRTPLAVEDWCFVGERQFREQMQYLKRTCQVIPLRELPRAIKSQVRRPLVALTFDDGFQNNYGVALPILQQLGLPATVFLATDFIGSEDTPWFCRINEALSLTSLARLDWEGETYDLSNGPRRAEAHARFQVRLKNFPHPELLQKSAQLITALGDHPGKPIPPDSPYRMLAAGEVREMAGSGIIEFGAHTCSHAILSRLSPAERSREITASLAAVERLTGAPCTLFAYPNGRVTDYGPCDVAMLRDSQTNVAVTTVTGPNDRSVPALEMRRYMVGSGTSVGQFKLMTHHVLWKLQTLSSLH
jgi:peptidoglycan/xylan/chitin deacetylase (PgdA/CDA1 family)